MAAKQPAPDGVAGRGGGPPSPCNLTPKVAETLVRSHFACVLESPAWKQLEDDDFLDKYADFFVAAAGMTSRLNVRLLEQAFSKGLRCEAATSAAAASRVSFLFKKIMRTVSNIKTGEKVSTVYVRVLRAQQKTCRKSPSPDASSSAVQSGQKRKSEAVCLPINPAASQDGAGDAVPRPADMSREDILKMYGSSRETMDVEVVSSSQEVMSSSQEVGSSSSAAAAGSVVASAAQPSQQQPSQQQTSQQQPPQQPEPSKCGALVVEWVEKNMLCRRTPDNVVVRRQLVPGPHGFCVALFPEGLCQTEIPNLIVAISKNPVAQKKPAGRGPGRPRKKREEEEKKDEGEEEDGHAGEPEDSDREAGEEEEEEGEADAVEVEPGQEVQEMEAEEEEEKVQKKPAAALDTEVEVRTQELAAAQAKARKKPAAAAPAKASQPAAAPAAKKKKSAYSNERTRSQVQCRPMVGKSFTYKYALHGGEAAALAKAREWLDGERAAGR